MRYRVLTDFDFHGQDIRLWCFRCARGSVLGGEVWEAFAARGWSMTIEEALPRFRCLGCGRADEVTIVPATRISVPPVSWADRVAGFFHASRARRKRASRAGR